MSPERRLIKHHKEIAKRARAAADAVAKRLDVDWLELREEARIERERDNHIERAQTHEKFAATIERMIKELDILRNRSNKRVRQLEKELADVVETTSALVSRIS